jgi:hypothetical protein
MTDITHIYLIPMQLEFLEFTVNCNGMPYSSQYIIRDAQYLSVDEVLVTTVQICHCQIVFHFISIPSRLEVLTSITETLYSIYCCFLLKTYIRSEVLTVIHSN